MSRQLREYELTAYHEAGHCIVGECIGYHFLDIVFGYDPVLGKFDGLTCMQSATLGFRAELLRTVAGFVAQLMREQESLWDLQRIKDRILADEFHLSNDSDQWQQLIAENGLTDQYVQILSSIIMDVFECLTRRWSILVAVAEACIATYDPTTQKGWLSRYALPNEVQEQLHTIAGTML